MAKLSPTEIKNRLQNIEAIYQDYIKKIENIRGQERNILADFIKKMEAKKIDAIRRSIQETQK
jgi:predicted transcriptional regulator